MLICLIAIGVALLGEVAANAEVITQTTMPIDTTVSVPCAAGGAGDLIALLGQQHAVFSVTTDAKGGQHISTHFNNVGVSGAGLTTGDQYQSTGVNRFSSNSSGPASEFTFINSFLMISAGAGGNLRVQETVYMTVNANGDVTANVTDITSVCK